jgi:hypothetical protein
MGRGQGALMGGALGAGAGYLGRNNETYKGWLSQIPGMGTPAPAPGAGTPPPAAQPNPNAVPGQQAPPNTTATATNEAGANAGTSLK